MLTALEEKNKKKADQYWPDEENKTQSISDSIELGRIINSFGSHKFKVTVTVHFKIRKTQNIEMFPQSTWPRPIKEPTTTGPSK